MLIAFEEPCTETIRAPVLKVFDGDGFKTMLWNSQLNQACEVVVRLGFTDAPELEQAGGKESKAFLTSLIADRWVELAVLLKMDTGGVVDRHGRIVCVPYLADDLLAGRMRNIELGMILNGWTWVWTGTSLILAISRRWMTPNAIGGGSGPSMTTFSPETKAGVKQSASWNANSSPHSDSAIFAKSKDMTCWK